MRLTLCGSLRRVFLVIVNAKGWYGGGRVGKKAGQGRYGRVGRRRDEFFLLVPAAPMCRPILRKVKASRLIIPAEISREKQTLSSLNFLKR